VPLRFIHYHDFIPKLNISICPAAINEEKQTKTLASW
jgi:hypothetical protein